MGEQAVEDGLANPLRSFANHLTATLTRLRSVNAALSGARLRHARSAPHFHVIRKKHTEFNDIVNHKTLLATMCLLTILFRVNPLNEQISNSERSQNPD